MLTELKQECKKFEEIPTMPVEVMERAGNSLKHVPNSDLQTPKLTVTSDVNSLTTYFRQNCLN